MLVISASQSWRQKSVQGHLLLQMKFKESLGYMRFSKGEKCEASEK